MKRMFLSVAAIVVVAVALAGCKGPLLHGSSGITTENSAPQVKVVLDLSLASQEVAINPATNTMWLATLQSVGKDTLWAIDMTTGTTQSFGLPDVDYNGYTTHVRIGPDGAVWVNLPYQLARWDPVSRAVTSLRFEENVDGALPDALESGGTLPGTWLSAILPDGTGVLVARNHVPYLTHVSADLIPSRGATVSRDYAGAADLARESDGTVLLLPSLDNPSAAIDVLGGGAIAGTTDGGPRRLFVDGLAISALSLDDSATRIVAAHDNQSGLRGLWTRENSEGVTVQYDPAAGTLTRKGPHGLTGLLQLERVQGQVSGGGIDPDTGKKTAENLSVSVMDRVTDFVVADDGTVWILRHNGTQLVRWNL